MRADLPPPHVLPRGDQPSSLTVRQEQIVRLLIDGHSRSESAQRLGISLNSYKEHLKEAKKRLGARTTVHLVALWLRTLAEVA